MPRCRPIYAHRPIKNAEIRSRLKPKNSAPILSAISIEYKIAVATVFVYLVEGLLGLPVFSNSPEKGVGLAYFVGPTMGYLIGFLFAAFFAGYLNFKTNLFVIFLKLILSVFFIYLFGIVWLGILIGWEKPIFKLGFFPFIYAELFKILLLTFLTSKCIKIRRFI